MSHDLPPVGFEPHDRKSPLTAPWEPIYRNAQGAWVVLGVQICAAHTNSRGLVHGGLMDARWDDCWNGDHFRGRAFRAAGAGGP
jgi:hypothetical protein